LSLSLVKPWIDAARLRRRLSRSGVDAFARREQLVRELAPGKSFLDAGGMWLLNGKVAFEAERAGASSVTELDGMDPTEEFTERQRSSSVRFIQGDVHDPGTIEAVGPHDVVWCTGLLYHTPNPFLVLQHLRQLCRGHLLLGTRVIPEVPGIEQACVFYPGLPPGAGRAYAAHDPNPAGLTGVGAPFDTTPNMGYGNFWWGMSPSAVRGMLRTVGFEPVEEIRPDPFSIDVVARAAREPSFIPEPGFSRRRGLEGSSQ